MFIWHLKHYRNYKSIVWDLCMQHLFNVSCWSAVYIISVLQILVHCDGNFDFMWISPLSGTSVHCHKQSTFIASICHISCGKLRNFLSDYFSRHSSFICILHPKWESPCAKYEVITGQLLPTAKITFGKKTVSFQEVSSMTS